jgi:glycosyltransferase involved in cell wall biosynthesis
MPRPARVESAPMSGLPTPTIAVDLRALVPAATGIGVYTRSLLLALAARGGARYVGMAHRPPRGAEELAAAGIAVERQEAPLGVLWQQLALPRRLARGDVDLFWSPLITLPLRCPVPAVATVHDLTVLLYPETHTLKVRLSLLPFLRRSFEAARRLVTISEATARDLAFHFPQCAEAIRVVYPGIDAEFRPGEPEEIAATRRELGAPEGYVLYAGTLEPRKNVGALLDAWTALRSEDARMPPLVLAGPYGWGSERLARRIRALAPEVTAVGRVDRARLVRIFQAARVFVYPSLYEGFGFPAAEALACGVPVVASNTSSLPEVVGDAGLLVDPRDVGGIAARIRALLEQPDKAAEIGARGVAQAGRFRWDRAAAEMEAVFLEALA